MTSQRDVVRRHGLMSRACTARAGVAGRLVNMCDDDINMFSAAQENSGSSKKAPPDPRASAAEARLRAAVPDCELRLSKRRG